MFRTKGEQILGVLPLIDQTAVNVFLSVSILHNTFLPVIPNPPVHVEAGL